MLEPAIQPSFDAANVRWLQPWSEPRREARFVARIAAEISWPMAAVIVAAPVVTVDMWFQSWQVPTRAPPRLQGFILDAINTSSPSVGGWWRPFSEPIRLIHRPSVYALLRESSWPVPVAVPSVTSWFSPLATPVRYIRDPRYTAAFDFYLANVTLVFAAAARRGRLFRSNAGRKPPTLWKGTS